MISNGKRIVNRQISAPYTAAMKYDGDIGFGSTEGILMQVSQNEPEDLSNSMV
jgi:hypothetical protein